MTSTPRSSQKRRIWPLFLLLATVLPQPTCAAPNTALDALPTTLLVDNSVPVLVGDKWVWVPENAPELHRRQDKDDKDKDKDKDKDDDDDDDDDEEEEEEEATALATATEDDSEPTRTGDGEGSGTASATKSVETSPLPSPFDNNLNFNFTSNGGKSCPRFLNELLTSEEFKECYPVSMVLQVSSTSPLSPFTFSPLTPPQDLPSLLRRHKGAPSHNNSPRHRLRRPPLRLRILPSHPSSSPHLPRQLCPGIHNPPTRRPPHPPRPNLLLRPLQGHLPPPGALGRVLFRGRRHKRYYSSECVCVLLAAEYDDARGCRDGLQ